MSDFDKYLAMFAKANNFYENKLKNRDNKIMPSVETTDFPERVNLTNEATTDYFQEAYQLVNRYLQNSDISTNLLKILDDYNINAVKLFVLDFNKDYKEIFNSLKGKTVTQDKLADAIKIKMSDKLNKVKIANDDSRNQKKNLIYSWRIGDSDYEGPVDDELNEKEKILFTVFDKSEDGNDIYIVDKLQEPKILKKIICKLLNISLSTSDFAIARKIMNNTPKENDPIIAYIENANLYGRNAIPVRYDLLEQIDDLNSGYVVQGLNLLIRKYNNFIVNTYDNNIVQYLNVEPIKTKDIELNSDQLYEFMNKQPTEFINYFIANKDAVQDELDENTKKIASAFRGKKEHEKLKAEQQSEIAMINEYMKYKQMILEQYKDYNYDKKTINDFVDFIKEADGRKSKTYKIKPPTGRQLQAAITNTINEVTRQLEPLRNLQMSIKDESNYHVRKMLEDVYVNTPMPTADQFNNKNGIANYIGEFLKKNNYDRDLNLQDISIILFKYFLYDHLFKINAVNSFFHPESFGHGLKKKVLVGDNLTLNRNNNNDHHQLNDKLYLNKKLLNDSNILELRYFKNGHLSNFKPVQVSGQLKKILFNVLNQENVLHDEINKLNNIEKNNLKILNGKFGFGLKFDDDDSLNSEYNVLKGEYLAGNNNPIVKQRLRQYIFHYVDIGKMTRHNAIKLINDLGL